MLFRKTVFALTLVGAGIPAAFANSHTGWAGSERGGHQRQHQNPH
ncbi:hypothetical protein [Polaromonas sp. CG9_12]|nr:hypothetical protein [Polaromonas sp. CG9_12]